MAAKPPKPKPKAAPAREHYHHGELRRALIDAALELIGSGGPEAFTLREAARRLGVNHRAAYRHFADKETLLAAVAEQGFWALLGAAREAVGALPEATPEARLLAIGRAYVRFCAMNPAHFRVMFGARLNEGGRFPALEVPIAEAFEVLQREVASGVEAGALAAGTGPRMAALSLWSAMHGLATLIVTRRIAVRKERLASTVDTLLEPTVRGLVAKR
ncbi:MAG: TetR/AcrR family transcriptional regulator [Deltaproteobacteria bacterium]|nr:TetR/AcrR family transcriptional regulator [Deltaproteobacteria bacterium]